MSLLQRRRGTGSFSLKVNVPGPTVGSVARTWSEDDVLKPVICRDVDTRYSQVERVAEGTCAVVYKAIRRDTQDEVALKVVRTSEDEMVAIGREEYSVLRGLEHPNIARAYDFIVSDRCTVLVMSFFDGMQLGAAVRRTPERRFPEQTARHLFKALLEALEHIHSRDIVHRDVKPANVLVSDDLTQLQLVDFNVASSLADKWGPLSPRCSPAYAAPEVRNGGSPSDAADIWGAGLCLAMMLTGQCTVKDCKVDVSGCSCSPICIAALKACIAMSAEARPSAKHLLESSWVKGITKVRVASSSYSECMEDPIAFASKLSFSSCFLMQPRWADVDDTSEVGESDESDDHR